MKRIPSGIQGLDKLISGGIPEKYTVLIGGGTGTGKTIFGLQFLCTQDDPGIFLSFEEELDQLRETSKSFGWDAGEGGKSRKIRFLRYDPFKLEDVFDILEQNIRELNARRVVMDSISTLGTYMHDIADLRRTILQIENLMKKNNCTLLLMSEINQPGALSRFGVEEFICDGVITLGKKLAENKYERIMSIHKMRGTDHSMKIHDYDITKSGIRVIN